GAQYGYWRDYAAGTKPRMLAKWHVIMPLVTMLCGYFPGKRLGWIEDTPKGIVRDWVCSRDRFEDAWRGRFICSLPRQARACKTVRRHHSSDASGERDGR